MAIILTFKVLIISILFVNYVQKGPKRVTFELLSFLLQKALKGSHYF